MYVGERETKAQIEEILRDGIKYNTTNVGERKI